jgi:hypothetical protein
MEQQVNDTIIRLATRHNRETLSVFLPESGQPASRPFDRAFLTQQLNLPQTPNGVQV